MKINNKYSIKKLDAYNIALVEHKTRGSESKYEGEEYESIVGYFGSLEKACMKALRLNIDTENMNTILDSIEEARRDIVNAIRECKPIV